MTPAEAIARLKQLDPTDPALFIGVLRGQASKYQPGLVDAVCDLALHALTDSPESAEPGLTIAETENWMGKLCEDSKAIDKEVDEWLASATSDPSPPPRSNPDGAYPAGCWLSAGEIEEAVRIMRTRGDALRQMEKDRNERADQVDAHQQLIDEVIVACGSLGLMASELPAHIASMRTELTRLRAEAKPRDDAEPEFPMQATYDDICVAADYGTPRWFGSIAAMVLWCVRKLGGARG